MVGGVALAAAAAGWGLSQLGESERSQDKRRFLPVSVSGRYRASREGFETARLRVATPVRERPGGRVIGRLGLRTRFGSPRILWVAARRRGWLGVPAPSSPPGRLGWIRAAATSPAFVERALRIDLSRRHVALTEGRRVLRRVRVGVGAPDTPTPTGRFAVTDLLHVRGSQGPYGCCVLALSGRQRNLPPGWPGGDRLAIHATAQTATIGRAVSLGCLRAGQRQVRWLMRRVPLGTPVFIRA